jgi:hypothetical protein
MSNHNQASAASAESANVVPLAPVATATWSDDNKLLPAEPIVPRSSMLNVQDVALVT